MPSLRRLRTRLGAQVHSAGQSVASSAFATFTAQLIGYALGFLASVLISRAVGPAGRGQYYVAVTAAATCVSVAHLSVVVASTYFFAQRRYDAKRLAEAAAALAVIIGPFVVAAMIAFFALARHSVFAGVDTFDIAVVTCALPFQLHSTWLVGLFLVTQRVVLSQLALLLGAVVQTTAAVVLYVVGQLDVHAILIIYAASILVTWALLVYWSREFAPARPRVQRDVLRNLLAMALKLHIGSVFWYLLLRIDVFLVQATLGTAAVGRYSLAVLFGELVWMMTSPLSTAAMPFQSAVGVQEAAPLTFKAARFNLGIGLGLAAGFSAVLWFVIPRLYGPGFAGAYPAFVALVPGVLAFAMVRPFQIWLVRQGRPYALSAISLAAFLLNVVLNLVLLRPLGIVGASVASSIAYVTLSGCLLLWGSRVAGVSVAQAFWPQPGDVETVRELVRRLGARLSV